MSPTEARRVIETAAVYRDLLKLTRKVGRRVDAGRPVDADDRGRLAELQQRHAELRGYPTAAAS